MIFPRLLITIELILCFILLLIGSPYHCIFIMLAMVVVLLFLIMEKLYENN